MKTITKEKLLERLFSSQEYIECFCDHFDKWMEVSEQSFLEFEKLISRRPDLTAKYDFTIRQWREKVIPNFKNMRKNMNTSLQQARKGNLDYIDAATGNLHSLSKDMDGIGWDWWKEIDSNYWEQYVNHSNKAERMAGNIYRTLSNYWRPGAILKETITGPITNEELKAVLEPGETFE